MRRGKRTTDYLLVDISNSYTKLAFATRKRLAKPMRHPTNDLTVAFLRRILRGQRAKTIVVSSVVPRKNKVIAGGGGFFAGAFPEPAA